MKYRRLGHAGIKVSEIGLGGWLTFGNAIDREVGAALIDKAFDLGINFFDSSNVYAGGRCEELWGGVLPSRPRSSYVLATKVFFPVGTGPNDRGLSRKHIMEQCHASLRRLKADYIDLYQCHRYDTETPLEETVRAMDDLVRQGKILYWGVSEWSSDQIAACMKICGDRFVAPSSNQPQYSLLQRRIEHDVMPECAKHGIGLVVFSPLAQGLLTGKYKPGMDIPEGSRAADDRQNQFIRDKAGDRALLERIAKLEPIAKDLGCTMAQLALAWVLHRQEVSSAIIGASRPDQIADNARAVHVKLDATALARIEAIFKG